MRIARRGRQSDQPRKWRLGLRISTRARGAAGRQDPTLDTRGGAAHPARGRDRPRDASNAANRLNVAAFSASNTLDVARLGLRSLEVRDCSWVTSTGAATGHSAQQGVPWRRDTAAGRRRPRAGLARMEVRPIPLAGFASAVATADIKTTIFGRRPGGLHRPTPA